jgi:hypothetical protein
MTKAELEQFFKVAYHVRKVNADTVIHRVMKRDMSKVSDPKLLSRYQELENTYANVAGGT